MTVGFLDDFILLVGSEMNFFKYHPTVQNTFSNSDFMDFDQRFESLHFRSYIFYSQTGGQYLDKDESSNPSYSNKIIEIKSDSNPSFSSKSNNDKSIVHRRRKRQSQSSTADSDQFRNYFITSFFNDSPTQIELIKLNEIFQECNGRMPSRRKLQEYSRQTGISQSRIRKWIMNKYQEGNNTNISPDEGIGIIPKQSLSMKEIQENTTRSCDKCGLLGLTDQEKVTLLDIGMKTGEIGVKLTRMEEYLIEIKNIMMEIEKYPRKISKNHDDDSNSGSNSSISSNSSRERKDNIDYWIHNVKMKYPI